MLKQSNVAIFSDLHLGVHGNSEEWHTIAIDWANWISKDLLDRGIKDILFLGDFFDNRSEISVQTMHVASEILNKFKEFNIIMIVGNHDAFYKNRSDVHSLGLLNGYDNITIVDKNVILNEFENTLLFVPWNNELPDGKFDYIFGHFEIQSFKMNNFKVCDKGLQVMDFLATKTDRVFSGHFHRRDEKKFNDGTINYVGNTFPMDFADAENPKGYYVLELTDGSIEFFENPVSPRFKKLSLSQIKKYDTSGFEGNIVKLIVDMEFDDNKLDKIKAYIWKFSPHNLLVEHNVGKLTINDTEEIDSIHLETMFEEFITQLSLEQEQEKRVQTIISSIYEKNNL